ncbi:hypothetical protein BGZ80_005859 [Entomortierella chlamydospora]|uniref:Uncharacterized protein n=1 Tax=Entomortierella chlamydospora TaxID=101097 RepID=A0A9P6MZH1_9FUNG|nr:hypothetical protein BGZ79_000134 [Entomortierella chlamydospora]KAG0019403.1 hypothetical protein BGZ80_005859 [Entomortierella chlamydospora]
MAAPQVGSIRQAIRPVHSDGLTPIDNSPLVNITPKYDNISGQYVVLWSEILLVYKNARCVMHGGRALSFLTDGNFEELKPSRISAYPNIVLDVVLNGDLLTSFVAATPTTNELDRLVSVEMTSSSTNDKTSSVETNASPTDHENETRVLLEKSVLQQVQRGPQSFVDTSDVPRIHGYMNMVHSLEWHEAPMPRLFIVLPRSYVEELTPKYDTFRLFWICEYMGVHPNNNDGNDGDGSDDEITPHLDLHPGFDLDRPADFFTKYGAHLLLNFQVFKYSSFNRFYYDDPSRPPLDGPDIDFEQAILFLGSSLGMTKEHVEQGIDMMIRYLQDITTDAPMIAQNGKSVGSYYSSTWETENLPKLTADDLFQLRSFLFTPGMHRSDALEVNNLNRTTDRNGHVHWVCRTHLHKVHPCIIFGQTFMMNTGAHCGTYSAQLGQIISRPSSGIAARQLYGILHSSPGFVSELHLHIGWSITVKDLTLLRNTIIHCNIVSLELTGPVDYMDSPAHSEIIVKILMQSRVQSFSLHNSQGVLKNVNPLWLTSQFSGLRTLKLKLNTNGQEGLHGTRIRLLWIILNTPGLKYLSVEWGDMEKVFKTEEFLWELLKRPFQGLEVDLKVEGQDISLTIDRCQIRNVNLKILNLSSAHNNPHIYHGYIKALTIMECADILDSSTQDIISWILSASPILTTLTLTCRAFDFKPTEQLIKKTVMNLETSGCFEKLILKETSEDSVTATFLVDPPKSSFPQQSASHNPDPVCLDVTVRDHEPGLESVLMNYGASVRTLNTTHSFGLRQLMFLSNSIERQRKSRLTSLLIAVDCGRWRGNYCLKNIFERCESTLKQLTLVGCMENPEERDHILWNLGFYRGKQVVILKSYIRDRQSSRVTEGSNMPLGGGNSVMLQWIQKVRNVIPRDTSLIVVEDFEALCEIVPGVTKRNIAWLQRPGSINQPRE